MSEERIWKGARKRNKKQKGKKACEIEKGKGNEKAKENRQKNDRLCEIVF